MQKIPLQIEWPIWYKDCQVDVYRMVDSDGVPGIGTYLNFHGIDEPGRVCDLELDADEGMFLIMLEPLVLPMNYDDGQKDFWEGHMFFRQVSMYGVDHATPSTRDPWIDTSDTFSTAKDGRMTAEVAAYDRNDNHFWIGAVYRDDRRVWPDHLADVLAATRDGMKNVCMLAMEFFKDRV